MFQTFSVDFDDDMVIVTCPGCGNSWMIDTLIFCAAVRDQTSLICPDCDSYLTFELSCLTRVAEQRNEAETSIPAATNNSTMMECGNCGVPRFVHEGTLEKCPNCGDDEFDLSLMGDAP